MAVADLPPSSLSLGSASKHRALQLPGCPLFSWARLLTREDETGGGLSCQVVAAASSVADTRGQEQDTTHGSQSMPGLCGHTWR